MILLTEAMSGVEVVLLPVVVGLLLRKQTVFTAREPLLAILETPSSLVALEPEQIVIFLTRPMGGRNKNG
jgi:hypothetical protein